MIGRHHPLERRHERTLRVGQEGCHAGERLLFLGIEDMQDRPDQQRMAGFLPMVAAFERPFRVDQDIGDILDVADLVLAAADLQQRVVMRRSCIGRIEQQGMRKARAPARGELPILALDVMDDRRAGPAQQGWYDQTDALARAGRRERHHMLGAVMAQVAAMVPTEKGAGIAKQPGAFHLADLGPARRTVGRDVALLARAPQ
ncbi:hypothetical protein D9M73_82350 [compost metagenome]